MLDDLHSHFKNILDDEWKKLILHSIHNSVVNGIKFPKYTHISILGSATAEDAIEEGFRFYRLCKPYLKQIYNLNSELFYMDFGCGTGRIFRIFMRDFPKENMIGVDVISNFIDICKKDFEGYKFMLIPHRPPIKIEDASIDIITSYSVFSHFSIFQNTRWIREFARIMRPGGFAFLTTYGRGSLGYLKSEKEDKLPVRFQSRKKIILSICSFEEFERLLSLGEMIYFPGSGHDYNPYDYGIAFLSSGFVSRIWGEYFELVEFIDDYQKLEQALIVLRRR